MVYFQSKFQSNLRTIPANSAEMIPERWKICSKHANFSVKIAPNWREFATIRDNSAHLESKSSDLRDVKGRHRGEEEHRRLDHRVLGVLFVACPQRLLSLGLLEECNPDASDVVTMS